MAKIYEEVLTIKISRLVKDNQEVESVLTKDLIDQVEAIVQELVGPDAIVEG